MAGSEGRGARQLELVLPDPAQSTAAPEEARERATRETWRWIERAAERWPAARGPVHVSFKLRGRVAGDACARTSTIRYNVDLLARFGDDFLAEIVPHEVAHLVVARVFPGRRRPHGAEWKHVMGFFGARARSCHAFETTPARRVGRIPYRCACPDVHLLTPRAHRRIRRGHAIYHCRTCRELLVWTDGGR